MMSYQLLLPLLRVLSLLLLPQQLNASPTGASSCDIGKASVGGPHLAATDVQTGAVSSANNTSILVLTMNGQILPVDDNGKNQTFSLSVDQNNTLSLSLSTEVVQRELSIKGFNFVLWYDESLWAGEEAIPEFALDLQSVFVDATATTTAIPNLLKINSFCGVYSSDDTGVASVAGLTHVNNEDKTEVTTTLLFGGRRNINTNDTNGAAAAAAAPVLVHLDVTVVMKNSDDQSIYFYSPYLLSIRSNDDGESVEDVEQGAVGTTNDTPTIGVNVRPSTDTTNATTTIGTSDRPSTSPTNATTTIGVNVRPSTNTTNATTTIGTSDRPSMSPTNATTAIGVNDGPSTSTDNATTTIGVNDRPSTSTTNATTTIGVNDRPSTSTDNATTTIGGSDRPPTSTANATTTIGVNDRPSTNGASVDVTATNETAIPCDVCTGSIVETATDSCCGATNESNATETQICELCNGGDFTEEYVFLSQTYCSLLVDEDGESRVESEDECFYNRALAAGYCGCTFPERFCNVCEGKSSSEPDEAFLEGVSLEKVIPGEIALTCAALFKLPAIDRDNTCSVLQAKYALWCECPGALAETVGGILKETENVTMFGSAIHELNVDKLLVDGSRNFTIFSPGDPAIENDELLQNYTTNIVSWTKHVTKILKNHIIGNAYVTRGELFSGAIGSLETLAGELLSIDKRKQTIGNTTILEEDLRAQNGVVHVIDGILHLPWQYLTIVDLIRKGIEMNGTSLEPETFNILVALLSQQSLVSDRALARFAPNGTTLIAPTDSAFGLVSDESRGSDRTNGLLYHIMESNLYVEEMSEGSLVVVPTRHPFADVLATRADDGTYRYNNATVVAENFAQNGVVHVIEEVLEPPTMIQSLGNINEHTNVELVTLEALFLAAPWNESPGEYLVQNATERLTLVAPNDEAMFIAGVAGDFLEQIITPEFSRHLDSLLKNLLLKSPYTLDSIVAEQGGLRAKQDGESLFTVDTIGGNNAIIPRSAIDLSFNSIDGIIHVVNDNFRIPESFAEDAYEYIKNNLSNSTIFSELLEQQLLDGELGTSIVPLTVLSPPNAPWGLIDTKAAIDALSNHIFEKLLFHDDLQEMDGEIITSVNGKEWIVSNLGGVVFLNSDDGGDAVEVISGDILVRNGVVHLLDGVLQGVKKTLRPSDAPSFVPTANPTTIEITSPTQLPSTLPESTLPESVTATLSPDTSKKCSSCKGAIDVNATLPDGSLCSAWLYDILQLDADSIECRLELGIAATYCGCVVPGDETLCRQLCAQSEMDATLQLPDVQGLRCDSIGEMASVDGSCNILSDKYEAYCGCQNAKEPVCAFCESGAPQDRPYILPNETSILLNLRMFGNLVDTSCKGFDDFFSVQTAVTCSDASRVLVDEMSYDMRAWCRCPGVTAPKQCGDFCANGSILKDSKLIGDELGLTCKYYSEIFDYAISDTVCAKVAELSETCCAPPIVAVNASFLVLNEENMDTAALARNRKILNAVFGEFAKALVIKTELTKASASSGRNLLASLQPSSSEIYAVGTAMCPEGTDAAPDSICHNIFGRFNLVVKNEDPKTVQERYAAAAESAIIDGTLQAGFDSADPVFPFTVAGLATETDAPPVAPGALQAEKNNDGNQSEKLRWWVILFVVLACLFGLCGVGFFFAYDNARRDAKTKEIEDEYHRAPMAEVSVHLLCQSNDDEEEGEVSVTDSHFWEMQESQRLVEEDNIVEKSNDRDDPDLEQAPVSFEEDGSTRSDLWKDETSESVKAQQNSWDGDDNEDDEEGEGEWNEDDGDDWPDVDSGSGEDLEGGEGVEEQLLAVDLVAKSVDEGAADDTGSGDEDQSQENIAPDALEAEVSLVDAPAATDTEKTDVLESGEDGLVDDDSVGGEVLEASTLLVASADLDDSPEFDEKEEVVSASLQANINDTMASFDQADEDLKELDTADEGSTGALSDFGEPIGIAELQAELADVDDSAFETTVGTTQPTYSEIVDSQNAWGDLQAAVETPPSGEPESPDIADEGIPEPRYKGGNEDSAEAVVAVVPPTSPLRGSFRGGLNGSFNASFHDM